ncbi:MAG: glycosyltransferase family 2 protein [Candidatus Caldatribacterium sp.]|uniref:glycosyltransferase family 2 protein n=1 Tax=Candidatus Caldatribacterium sp. TaxID=2282143 RepID=UPI002990F4E7|nr:glycosyltransferase family 2 protein [Candidatus Caldatribacterium sp.]MCX7731297.1 glycosyltransferase family 2 protein [Candidatus Caldatribacterium sp.]MDW8080742.1 glycosyltransferase family 2 protein [Candidatus Calescibacterium sp.]
MGEKKTTAIIAAYNEERTIGPILDVLRKSPVIDQIVVVSDGSTDRTVEIARSKGAEVVELLHNVGKGGALYRGLEYIRSDVVLLLDADLIGLNEKHVEALVMPVLSGEADVAIGVFEEGRLATDLAQRIAPFLSGQRAIRTDILQNIPDLEVARYGVEVAINRYVRRNGVRVKLVKLPGLTHVMKEEKLGLVRGFRERMRMYWEIFKNMCRKTNGDER